MMYQAIVAGSDLTHKVGWRPSESQHLRSSLITNCWYGLVVNSSAAYPVRGHSVGFKRPVANFSTDR